MNTPNTITATGTVIFSKFYGSLGVTTQILLSGGEVITWESKTAPTMRKGREVSFTARIKKQEWETGNMTVTHLKIK